MKVSNLAHQPSVPFKRLTRCSLADYIVCIGSKWRDKDFLTPTQAAELLGIGRMSVYRYIRAGKIKVNRFDRKTLISKADLLAMFDFLPPKEENQVSVERTDKTITEFYTRAEIREKFGVKDSWIYKVVAENNVPKTILRGKAYFSKAHIDRLFSARKENPEITEWYSVEDIQHKYGMSLSAIYSLVSKVGIPKRKEGPKVYYSKYHFDVAKGTKSAEDVEFISVADAMEKYSLTRDQLYHYVKTYKITKLRCGKYVKLNAKELVELFNNKIQLSSGILITEQPLGSRQAIPLRQHRQPTIGYPTHNVVQLISVARTAKSTNPTAPHSNS